MKKIYKYPLNPYHTATELYMPRGAKVLCAQTDEKTDCPCIWALVDVWETVMDSRIFFLHLTGLDIDVEGKEYIGTVQLSEGGLILHVFEKTN